MTSNRLAISGVALMALTACASVEMPASSDLNCATNASAGAVGVRAARTAFNQAIRDEDIDAIAGLLAPQVTLVTGTDSALFNGREAQLSIWREDFEAAERAVYERATDCVSVSPLFPIALESGRWRGQRTDNPGAFAAGVYSAKWRAVDGEWKLEAEIFSTESCGGSMCPAETAP